MYATVAGVSLDLAMKANRVGLEGRQFREALGRVSQELTGEDDEIGLTGMERDVHAIIDAVKAVEKPVVKTEEQAEEQAPVKSLPTRTATKQRALARVANEKAEAAEKKKVERPKTQAEAKAARLERQAAEKKAAKPARTTTPKVPSVARAKTFNAEGQETWVCACGKETIASQQTYNLGWRIPRGSATAICPECRAKATNEA